MLQALQNGIGATASVLKCLLHPKKVISKKYAHIAPQECLDDLLVLKKGVKAIKSKDTAVIFFHHDDFLNQILYVANQFCKVLKEGLEEEMFEKNFPPSESEREESKSEDEDGNSDRDVLNLNLSDTAELICQVQGMGY
eukprot:11851867-Ditylum_brightwellii.AAC.1